MKIDNTRLVDDKGFSAIGMAIVLLLLGAILMSGFNGFSLSKRKNMIAQKRYYVAVNHALSSISWAITQNWSQPTDSWQCKIDRIAELNACIKQSTLSTGNYTIIRGQFGQVKRYHLATFVKEKLTFEKRHWLDYYPANRNVDCD